MSSSSTSKSPAVRDQRGFTLLEVMISVVIMAFISLGIYQLTTETYRLRDALTAEAEFYNGIRMSMDILQKDVMSLYSPVIARPPEKKPAPGTEGQPPSADQAREQLEIQSSDEGRTSQFWQGATDKSGIRNSHFIGTDSKMSFISASHVRIYRDAPESNFAKVTYELGRDTENRDAPDSLILFKVESPNVFDDDERRDQKFTRRFPLLKGIKTLRYRYWRKDGSPQGKWEASWDSDKEDFKDKYPDMIEVTFEVVGAQNLSFNGIYHFRPEVPLRGLEPSS